MNEVMCGNTLLQPAGKYYIVLHKEPEHLRILISLGVPGTSPPRIPKDDSTYTCVYLYSYHTKNIKKRNLLHLVLSAHICQMFDWRLEEYLCSTYILKRFCSFFICLVFLLYKYHNRILLYPFNITLCLPSYQLYT